MLEQKFDDTITKRDKTELAREKKINDLNIAKIKEMEEDKFIQQEPISISSL